jgi:hypothetical protein
LLPAVLLRQVPALPRVALVSRVVRSPVQGVVALQW